MSCRSFILPFVRSIIDNHRKVWPPPKMAAPTQKEGELRLIVINVTKCKTADLFSVPSHIFTGVLFLKCKHCLKHNGPMLLILYLGFVINFNFQKAFSI